MIFAKRSHLAAFVLFIPMWLCGADTGTTDPALRRIQERFLAPCCWNESLALHRSPDANEMRAEIARMVAAGKTEQEIVDRYVALHGERILREPRGTRFQWLNWIPVVAVGLGFALLLWYVFAHRARGNGWEPQQPQPLPANLPQISDDDFD
jgi:cytochrome c-type biogenesis protein CcmH